MKDVEPHNKINASAGYREPVVPRVTLKSTSAESGGLKPLQNHLFNQIYLVALVNILGDNTTATKNPQHNYFLILVIC